MTLGPRTAAQPLSILHVIASVAPRYGGPSFAMPGMARALAARGHLVEVVTTNIDGPGELDVPIGKSVVQDGYSITYWPVQFPRSYKFSLPLGQDVFRRVARADIVHIHSLFLFHGLAAGMAARRSGTPYVVRPHGTLDPYHRSHGRLKKGLYWRLWERRNLDHASALHFTSGQERDLARSLRLRAPSVVVPLGVPTPTMTVAEAAGVLSEAWPAAAGRHVVTFLGRLTAKKRVPLLLEAFAGLRVGDAYLIVAGPDNEGLLGRYRDQARALGIADRTSFPGAVVGQLKEALLTRSSVFVLPSLDENMGVAVLEAMAHAVPVIVTAGVALQADIQAVRAGLVVPPDAAGLTRGIAAVLGNAELRAAMGKAGATLVRARYSWDVVGGELEALYIDILAGRDTGASVRAR